MSESERRTVLLLRLRKAVADKEAIIACANRELQACGNWAYDWSIGMAGADDEFAAILRALEEKP